MRPLVKKLAWVVAGIVQTAAVYEIAINAFLSTRAFRNLASSDPESLQIDYTSAASFWPGRAHVKNLRVRGKDSHVEWQLDIDDCTLQVNVLDLLHHRFHVEHVHGDGVAFILRQRLSPDAATPEKLARIPAIPSFEAVPIKPPPTPPPTDADYHLWTVWLGDVDAEHTRDVWLDDLHFVGDARVRGGFYLRPIRWVSVDPSDVEIERGEIRIGKVPFVAEVHGHVDFSMSGFDPRTETDVTGRMVVSLRGDGAVVGLAPLAALADVPGMRVDGGSGPVHVDARLSHGGIEPGSQASLSADDVVVEMPALEAAGSAKVSLSIPEPRTATVSFEASPFHLAERSKGGVTVAMGALSVSGWLQKAGDDLHGDATILGRGADVHVAGHQVRGDVDVKAALRDVNLDAMRLDLGGTRIAVRDVRAEGATGWWANVDIPTALVATLPHPSFHGVMRTSMRDGDPLLRVLIEASPLPNQTAAVVSTKGLAGSLELSVAPGHLGVERLVAKGGDLAVRGDFTKDGSHDDGAFLVTWGPLTVGLDMHDGSTRPVVLDASRWFSTRTPVRRR